VGSPDREIEEKKERQTSKTTTSRAENGVVEDEGKPLSGLAIPFPAP
jgi:hypothetical protein